MPLSPGDKLGSYRILAPLGAGGMGEVYRGMDTKLDREVAIKVLPAALAQDPERLARFEREAKVLASLNHANIAIIHRVEEAGGIRALIMELVPGHTLKGPLPLDEALRIAAQIADALGAAHDKGITHRDLKPLNVMITPEGVVKVLDFGLAAVTRPSASSGGDASQSPTMTMSPTGAGMILGTAAYMSPEQARGQTVDRRADIWAFGVLLYEMLTGKQLFHGETVSDILASVLKDEPALDQVPAKVRPLLRRCLEKDPKKRLQAIGDWDLLIRDDAPPAPAQPTRHTWMSWALAAAVIAMLSLTAWTFLRPAPLPEVTRFEIHAPEGSRLPLGTPAPSPDGRSIAYTVTGADGISHIHVRSMDSTESRALPGTENAVHPFWSPDGRTLAFATGSSLKSVDIAGGSARALAAVAGNFQGSWSRDGVILFSAPGGLSRISADGGQPTVIAKRPETTVDGITFPYFLSDSKRFLVRVLHGDGGTSIELASLDSLQRTTVIPTNANAPILAPTPDGKTYLLYLRDAALVAQEFDEGEGKVKGNAVVLVNEIGRVGGLGTRPTMGVSPNGILAYQTGRGETGEGEISWWDRSGKRLSQFPPSAAGNNPTLSPDGKIAAVESLLTPQNRDIILVDLARGVSARFTFSPGSRWPVWSPDGKRVAYQSAPGGKPGIYVKDASGAGKEQLLIAGPNMLPTSWSPDGGSILYADNLRFFLLPLSGDKKPLPVDLPVFSQNQARMSPDGKYIAYASSESVRPNIYIQAVPPNVGKWQISVNGGAQPRWRRDGKELFFLSVDEKMMAVDVNLGATVTAGVPHELFQASAFFLTGQRFDVSADGQRFLMFSPASATGNAPITVVMNWWAGLNK